MEGGKDEGIMEGEAVHRSGPWLVSLRWDSDRQGGSGRRKMRRRRRKGMGEPKRDMAVVGSTKKWE